jgi:hypothetical protein
MVGRILSTIFDAPVTSVKNLPNDSFQIEFGTRAQLLKCLFTHYKNNGTLSVILENVKTKEYDFIFLAVPTPIDIESGVWSSEIADSLIGKFPNLKKLMGLFWGISGLPSYWKEQLFLIELKREFPSVTSIYINTIHPERLLENELIKTITESPEVKYGPFRFRKTRTILSNKMRTLFSRHPDKFLRLWQRFPQSLRNYIRRALP